MHRHFLIVVGWWKFENWHVYHYTKTGNIKGNITWWKWRRVI